MNIENAYDFYKKFILNEEKFSLLNQYNIRIAGSISSRDWELFGAILTGDKGREEEFGADLLHYEVKSSILGENFEYAYYRNTGLKKLQEDMKVDHILVSYSPDYLNVIVRVVQGKSITNIFKDWEKDIEQYFSNINEVNKNIRYRKRIPYKVALNEGKIIMVINNRNLEYVPQTEIDDLNYFINTLELAKKNNDIERIRRYTNIITMLKQSQSTYEEFKNGKKT